MLVLGSAARILAVTLAGVTIGLASSLATIAFVAVLNWANDLLLLSPSAREAASDTPTLLTVATLCVPALGGLGVGLILARHVKSQRPLGPADAILAVQIREPMPDGRSAIAGTLASLLALCTGASAGQYGPLVYMGAAIGARVRRLERRFRDIRSIAIACGVAAAISTAFSAPIAGLIFAHEVILRHYALRAFAPVAVAAATGHVSAYLAFGSEPILGVSFDGLLHSYEFLLFAVEGILAAFLAALFMALVLAFGRTATRLPIRLSLRPAAAGLVLGVVALQVPEVLGVGQETLIAITHDVPYGMSELLVLVTAKILLSALCVGFGFAGGVFSPALLIGCFGGALFGLGVSVLLPFETSGILPYTVCGMMAVASPVIGAPLSTILIVFELTGSYDLTIAVMTSVAFANLIGHKIIGRSLFDVQLRHRGFDLSHGRDRAILARHNVREFLSQDYTTMHPEDHVEKMIEVCASGRQGEVLLVDDDGQYCGRVRITAVLNDPGPGRLEKYAESQDLVFREDTNLWNAMALLQGFVGEAVPLVAKGGRLMGVVPESAVIHGYIEATRELRREENAGA